jgi:tetratricopeptide (TPR) repeat protein
LALADFKAAVQAGQYQTARWLFVQLLDDAALSTEDMAEAYCEASVAEYRAGHLHTAVAWSKVAVKLASETNQRLLLSRAALNLIEFLRLSGDTAGAIDTGLRWLSDHGDNPEVAHRKGRFHYNLAVIYHQRGDVDRALEHYELAWTHLASVRSTHPDASERDRCLVYEVMALQNAAWLFYEEQVPGTAEQMVAKARRLIPTGNTTLAREQMLLEALSAHNQGDSASVLTMVNAAFSEANSIPTRQLFWLYWLAAKALIQTKASTANAYATMAMQAAEETRDSRLIRLGSELEQEIGGLTS